jgi:hypothetical protein
MAETNIVQSLHFISISPCNETTNSYAGIRHLSACDGRHCPGAKHDCQIICRHPHDSIELETLALRQRRNIVEIADAPFRIPMLQSGVEICVARRRVPAALHERPIQHVRRAVA